MPTVTIPGYLSEREAAELLGYSALYLSRLRRRGIGPVYIKRGHVVAYKASDVEAWLDRHRIDPEAV